MHFLEGVIFELSMSVFFIHRICRWRAADSRVRLDMTQVELVMTICAILGFGGQFAEFSLIEPDKMIMHHPKEIPANLILHYSLYVPMIVGSALNLTTGRGLTWVSVAADKLDVEEETKLVGGTSSDPGDP
eukprot:TRINITY_DN6516_c1_g2_i4.p1 TRINITY_DN6516_c1_g2~~TRINITY_DN6516_c1_g2_i4.p1  ORF type:complete len:131 (-),score=22.14 TRINITY_DN6516_c1_g2_i4:63-455(-)